MVTFILRFSGGFVFDTVLVLLHYITTLSYCIYFKLLDLDWTVQQIVHCNLKGRVFEKNEIHKTHPAAGGNSF